jgi:peptidoglycan lytic transglycosylase
VERAHKLVMNAIALGALVSGSMAASAPTRSDHQITPASQRPTKQKPKPSAKAPLPFAIGTASWYGKAFDGKTTASGEPFDMYELTAAHRTLRLGSWVKVTNLRNHRWVLVRINDRGPVPADRIIDLSYSAARILKMSGRGIAKVRLDVMKTSEQSSDFAMLNHSSLIH